MTEVRNRGWRIANDDGEKSGQRSAKALRLALGSLRFAFLALCSLVHNCRLWILGRSIIDRQTRIGRLKKF